MRLVLLAIQRHALEQFLALFRRFNADAENLHFSFQVSFPFVNKGRHLGPAPRSPAATLEANHRGRRLGERRGKCDGHAIVVFECCRGKLIADC